MANIRKFSCLAFILAFLIPQFLQAKTFYDAPDTDLGRFFASANSTYVIRYQHAGKQKITIPSNSTLNFDGGSIQAPVEFCRTTLKGTVRLHGSRISGTIANKTFNARWLCYADGKKDDATNINEILSLCKQVFFPRGTYLLEAFHTPLYPINKPYHLGINRSGISLKGEEGTVLLTRTKAGTLCIYSKPYALKESVAKITIEGLTFQVENEDTGFDPYQEHCHTISFIGVKGATVKNCQFKNYWGDAICLNHYNDNENTGERTRNMKVILEGNRIDGYKHSNRNGISIISGEDVIIKNNQLKNCAHSKMPGAIDIEPNSHVFTINNIRIMGNTIDACQGNNAAISVVSNKRQGPIHNVLIRDNRITNSTRGLEFAVECDDVADEIKVENNFIDENTDPYIFYGKGKSKNWSFKGNIFKRASKRKLGGEIRIFNLKTSKNQIKGMAWNISPRPFLFVSTVVLALILSLVALVRKFYH